MPIIRNILTILVCAACITTNAFASSVVTGTAVTVTAAASSKKVAEKYTLKNLSALNHKLSSFSDLKSSLTYKGLSVRISTTNKAAQTNYLKYNKGNITYVIPYRYKVLLPKFRSPSPQNN